MILQNFTNGYDVAKGSMLAAGEKNDCAVRAFANAFQITYDTAHKFAEDVFGRKARRGTQNVFNKLNELKEVTFDMFADTLFPESKTYNLVGVNAPINADYTHKPVAFTVKTFCAKYNKGTFIVLVNKHALTVKDGIVIDNPDMRFTGYRRVVESFIKVC